MRRSVRFRPNELAVAPIGAGPDSVPIPGAGRVNARIRRNDRRNQSPTRHKIAMAMGMYTVQKIWKNIIHDPPHELWRRRLGGLSQGRSNKICKLQVWTISEFRLFRFAAKFSSLLELTIAGWVGLHG